jgi:zinc/manganese transport system substrate-binding protein
MSGLLKSLMMIAVGCRTSAAHRRDPGAATCLAAWVRCLGVCILLPCPAIAATPLRIVAAENFYGDIARQIGGTDVTVQSILSNPNQDPHLFEVSPSVGRNVSGARIVIESGADYDPWMVKLLEAARGAARQTIVVAALIGKHPGDNPHIWYDPATMLVLAKTLAADLTADDPAHKSAYERRLAQFRASIQPIEARIAALRGKFAGTPVTATEPVLGYMFAALGMQVRNMAFQMAVMNNTEPGASDVAAFQNDLRTHKVRLLVYNSQATDPIAMRMQEIARQSHIPIVGATETEPPGKTYQVWMMSELDALDRAMAK